MIKTLVRDNPVGNLCKYEVYDTVTKLFGYSNLSMTDAKNDLNLKNQHFAVLVSKIQNAIESIDCYSDIVIASLDACLDDVCGV